MEESQDAHRNTLVPRVWAAFMDWIAAHKLDLGLLMFAILATLATCLHYIYTMHDPRLIFSFLRQETCSLRGL